MIHAKVEAEKLALLRIVLFGALAIYAMIVPGELLAVLPAGFQRGVGLAEFLPAWCYGYSSLLVLRWSAAALLALAALGLKPFRPIAVAAMALMTLYVAMLHPGHRELGALYLGYGLAVGPSADVWSLAGRRAGPSAASPEARALTLQVATLAFLLTYTMIGTQRLLYSAPRVFLDDSLVWHLAGNSDRNGSFGFALGYRLLEGVPHARTLLSLSFLMSTLLEALAPLALFLRSFRWLFVGFAVIFHAANLLLLNIEFTLNLLVIILLLIDWNPRLWTRGQRHAAEMNVAPTAVAADR